MTLDYIMYTDAQYPGHPTGHKKNDANPICNDDSNKPLVNTNVKTIYL